MKYWWDNLDDDEKMTAFAIGGMVLAIIAILQSLGMSG